jgi:hypothetical protein
MEIQHAGHGSAVIVGSVESFRIREAVKIGVRRAMPAIGGACRRIGPARKCARDSRGRALANDGGGETMQRSLAMGAFLLACALAPTPAAMAAQGFIQCASTGYKYQYCAANTQGRVVLLRELSTGNLCRQGRGWGYDSGGIWVDHGCRGEFSFGRDDGGGGGGAGQLVCGGGYRFCTRIPEPGVAACELSTETVIAGPGQPRWRRHLGRSRLPRRVPVRRGQLPAQ